MARILWDLEGPLMEILLYYVINNYDHCKNFERKKEYIDRFGMGKEGRHVIASRPFPRFDQTRGYPIKTRNFATKRSEATKFLVLVRSRQKVTIRIIVLPCKKDLPYFLR